ncbi:unnamed protein product [Lupinus luteus]|uniref:Uncharacterized protein n=1 Tax=Lupinus luteus TaxID=3873 RepID=A0AAV1Y1L7_LUPLU
MIGYELILQLRVQLKTIMVQKITVKRLQPLEQEPSTTSSANSAYSLSFKIICSRCNFSHIPFSINDLRVPGDIGQMEWSRDEDMEIRKRCVFDSIKFT